MKAVRYSSHNNKNSTILHCSGAEETLISCFLPDTWITSCYYLLVGCKDLLNSREHIMSSTQTPVITASNTPLPPVYMSGIESSSEDGGVPIAMVAGVIGAIVVIIGIILLVVVLIVVLSQKNKEYKNNCVNSR